MWGLAAAAASAEQGARGLPVHPRSIRLRREELRDGSDEGGEGLDLQVGQLPGGAGVERERLLVHVARPIRDPRRRARGVVLPAGQIRRGSLRRVSKSHGLYGGRDPADVPAYTLPEAAALVGLHPSTLRSWVRGRKFSLRGGGERRTAPIIVAASPDALSFTNVVEAHVLTAMRRKYKLDLKTIRDAVRYVTRVLAVEHPLARIKFKTDEVNLFVEHLGALISASEEGQIGMREVLDTYLERVEYGDDGRAVRFFPLYREAAPRIVVVDPRRAFGRPVLHGTSAPVVDIRSRFEHGDSVHVLAKDYGVTAGQIEEALRAATPAA